MTTKPDPQTPAEETPTATANVAAGPRVNFKSEGIKSSYANFVNANGTREEVVLNFGINQDWDRSRKELEIDLTHRVVLSPFAAKRLAAMLQQLMSEYERRYGELK